MKRWIGIILILVLASGMGSCIFQNDPAKPNSPPIIKSYQPDSTYMYRKVPDTLVFLIRAIDLDGDQLDYRFLIEDEVSSTTNSLVFYADFAGEYHIQGLVYDGSDSVFHNWYVDVRGHDNEPPYINWFLPEQANVACAVGDVLEFHIGVIDDDPASLRYYYTLDSLLLSSTSPNLLHRFMERGDYTLRGIAWDGEYGDTIEWYVGVTGYPDTICPSSIIDLEGEPGEEIGTIRLTWTAPGDDSTYGTASGYILRTSLTPIQSEEDWNDAAGKVGEPEPSPSGSQETMIARNLNPGTYLYATMRAVDDFFNLSPLGKCERILVRGIDIQGRVIDSRSCEAVEGFIVSAGGIDDTTDAYGSYTLKNLPLYTKVIRAMDEVETGSVGDYYDCTKDLLILSESMEIDFYAMPVLGLANTVPPYYYYDRFIAFFKDITETSGWAGRSTVFKRWNHMTITIYNPPRIHGEIDLQATARDAMNEWEDMTGLDLFFEVDDEEIADTRIVYSDSVTSKHHVITIEYNPDGTPAKREVWIYPNNTMVPLWRYARLIFTHELGHVIGLMHSRNVGHVMLGLTLPQVEHVTEDEANVVKILFHSPFIVDYDIIIEE